MIDSIFDGVMNFLLVILAAAFLVLAIRSIAGARQQSYQDSARIGFNAIMGMVLCGLAFGAVGFARFGKEILSYFNVT